MMTNQGYEVDEDEDKDDDGNNDLEEDEVHYLAHRDTDQFTVNTSSLEFLC